MILFFLIEWKDEFREWRVYESRRKTLDVSDGSHRSAASAGNRASFEAFSEAVLDSTASLRVLQLSDRESDVRFADEGVFDNEQQGDLCK